MFPPTSPMSCAATAAFLVDGTAGDGITAGEWWPADYDSPPLASLDTWAARRLGLDIGDTLTLSVLGAPLQAGHQPAARRPGGARPRFSNLAVALRDPAAAPADRCRVDRTIRQSRCLTRFARANITSLP